MSCADAPASKFSAPLPSTARSLTVAPADTFTVPTTLTVGKPDESNDPLMAPPAETFNVAPPAMNTELVTVPRRLSVAPFDTVRS